MLLSKFGIKEEFETTTNDFKRYLNDGAKSLEWLKTVCAMANTKGGTIYVGVDNDNYEPKGLDKSTIDSQVQLFWRSVKEHIHPEPNVDIRYLPFNKERYIIEFNVKLSSLRPCILSYNGNGSIFVRDEGKTRLASTEEIQRMAFASAYVEYDSVYSNRSFVPNDFQTLYRVYETLRGEQLTEKELFSVGFFDANKTLRQESLLFADDYKGEETALSMTRYPGLTKGDDLLFPEPLFAGNILDGIALVQSYVKKHAVPVYIKTSDGGRSSSSYPERAVTEAIVNAYAHKNYLIPHSQIEVNVFLDRLEIISPGSVVGRAGFSKKMDLASLIPIRRNPFICEVLSMLNLMERRGSGFDKIEKQYASFASSFKPFASSDEVSFTLTLPDLSYVYGVADADNTNLDIVFPEVVDERSNSKAILSYCYFKERSMSDIASFLGVAISSYLRNEVLGGLTERGLLIAEKKGKKDIYRSNPAMVKIRGTGNWKF